MQFVHPFFLLAISAVAIPILIHLFNFRKFKKVYFTNVHFLHEIQQETKRQSQLKQILILCARILAISCLVLAFAKPYIPSSLHEKKISGQHYVSIYLDNSFSMEALATQGKLIDIAKTKAQEIASAYTTADLFQLLTNDFEGKHQHFVTREEFRKLVEDVKLSPTSRPLPDVISRMNDLLYSTRKSNRDAYLISDFQKTTASFYSAKPDSSTSWYLVPLSAVKNDNLYIDTVYFLSPIHQPGQPVKLLVKIRNEASDPLEKVPVKLTINSVQKAISSFSVGANSRVEVVLTYTENPAGFQFGKIEINDYPIIFDDKFHIAYTVSPCINILCINEKEDNRFLSSLFAHDSAFRFTSTSSQQLDYSSFNNYSIVILNGATELSSGLIRQLQNFVLQGGSLAIFPPENATSRTFLDLSSQLQTANLSTIDTNRQRISSLQLASDLFNDIFEKGSNGKVTLPENIDLPEVFRHYTLSSGLQSGMEVLMRLQNNDPFLVLTKLKEGKIYIFTVPLIEKWSNFPKHLIFVPTLYKIALLSNKIHPLFYPVGENSLIEIPLVNSDEKNLIKIRKKTSEFEIIPEQRKFGTGISLFTHGQIKEDGWYSVASGKSDIEIAAFNFNRNESDMNCFSVNELQELTKKMPAKNVQLIIPKKSSLTQQIHELKQGTPLWKFFIMFALLFLAIEISLIRWMK
ncbi:MAG: BatA domain-containing protein [Bacteroidales bacterium]|nr:BatA domain-containing protein [Bacteroidales bacterium]